MILNYSQDYMDHMMDWGPNGWILLILGGVIFLLFVIILFYFLFRNNHKENISNSLERIVNSNNKYSETQTQNYNTIASTKEKEVNLKENTLFCPACGEKLNERTLNYCPFCGNKI